MTQTLGNRSQIFKSKILAAGYTPKAVAEKLNIHINTMYRYINNPSQTPVDTLSQIVCILNLTPSESDSIFMPMAYHYRIRSRKYEGSVTNG